MSDTERPDERIREMEVRVEALRKEWHAKEGVIHEAVDQAIPRTLDELHRLLGQVVQEAVSRAVYQAMEELHRSLRDTLHGDFVRDMSRATWPDLLMELDEAKKELHRLKSATRS